MRGILAIGAVGVLLGGLGLGEACGSGGQLVLTVVDKDTGKPIPCRIHLKTANGKPRKVEKLPFWFDHVVCPGQVTLQLPKGSYSFELERGPEYVTCSGHFTVDNFADDAKTVELQRCVEMAKHGWWSGDLDVHRPASEIELLMQADDVHVVPLISWWNNEILSGAKSGGKEPLVQFDTDRYCQLLGGGHVRAGGTLLYFNLPKPLLLVGADREYPPPARFVEQARQKEGVWIDLAKPFGWDLPALVAHGQIDSIQVAHGQICRTKTISEETDGKPRGKLRFPGNWGNAQWSQEIYFQLLNSGLRIPPTAGSGSGVTPNPVGYNRVYVHVDGEFSYEKWWENLKAGRVTITNGPLLEPKVAGELPGHTFHGHKGQIMDFEIGLTFATREPISYLELIQDGRVAHSIRFNEYAKSGRLPKLEFRESGWFLVRAVTDLQQTYRFAMTGPYFVEFDEKPRISKRSVQFFLDWVYERARQIKLDDADQQREVLKYHREARDFWQDLLSRANAE
ncbi:MAG: hypothetical protein ABFD16_30615 [Thermoguttaceae bacterium]